MITIQMRCGRQIPDFWKKQKNTFLSVQNTRLPNKEKLTQPNRQTRNTGIRWKMYLNSRQIPLTRRPRQMCKVTLKFRYSLERFYHRESICCRWWERASRSEYISQQIPAESQVWTSAGEKICLKGSPDSVFRTPIQFFGGFFLGSEDGCRDNRYFLVGPDPLITHPIWVTKIPSWIKEWPWLVCACAYEQC